MTTTPHQDANPASPLSFELSAASVEMKPAVALDSRWPATHNGLPVHLRWVRSTISGDWKHPTSGEPVNITPERVANWAKNVKAARAAGVVIPASTSHKHYKDPNRTLGYVHDARVQDGELELLTGYVGDDSLATASKNYFSIGIEPNVSDARGNVYDELLTHLASTPTPVLETPGFVTLSRGEPIEADSTTLAPLQKGVEMLDTKHKARVTQYLGDTASDDPNEVISLLLGKLDSAPKPEAVTPLSTELAAAKAVALSREDVAPDPRIANLIYRAAKADVSADIASGAYSRATGDLLLSYVESEKGKPNTLLLSREDAVSLTFDQARELAKNSRPGLIGKEQTGIQTAIALGREVPDADENATKDVTPERQAELMRQSGFNAK